MADIEKVSMIDKVMEQISRRKWLVLVTFLSVFTAAVCLVVALPQLYRASTTILFTQDDIAESLLKDGVTNELELRLSTIRQAVMSRSQLQEIVDEFDLYAQLKDRASAESVINRFRKDIRIEQEASTQLQWGEFSTYAITISYQDWSPDRAALIANELVARYRAENERIRMGHAVRTTEFVREQLESARARFEAQEQGMNEFKNAHISELPEQQGFNLATLDRLNSDLQLNSARQVHLLDRRANLLPGIGAESLTGSRRLEWLQRELAVLETRFTAKHPDVVRLQREIQSLTQQSGSTDGGSAANSDLRQTGPGSIDLDGELQMLRQEEGRLRSAISGLVQSLEGVPRIEQELKRFAYEYDSARNEYLSLQQLYQDANVAESLESRRDQQFRIIEVAIPPDVPIAPNRERLLFLSFMLAVGVAGAALFLAEQLDGGFHSTSDIRRFTGVPILASIPRIQTASGQWRSRARFSMVSVIFVAGLLVLAVTSFYAGTHASQLVLAISN